MISVIIPAYNEVANLKRLVPRLEDLAKGHEVEIILSIGKCTSDYSSSGIDLSKVRFIANKRKGRAKQMNDGANNAMGNTFVFLHADVFPPEGFFRDIERTIAEGNDAGFFSYQFDKKSVLLSINASFTKRDGLFTGGGDQCLFIKKKVFEKLGRFDESQVLMEDFEFFKRMKRAGVPYKIVENDLVVSARKYAKNSYLRVNLTNLLLVILFRMRVPSKKLQTIHDRLLRIPYRPKKD